MMIKKQDLIKNYFFQDVRGICIIAVIMIHSGIGSITDLNTLYYGIALRQFVYFPVAIFFFLSGFFCDLSKYNNWGKDFKKRIFRIVVPYLLWSFLYILFQICILGADYTVKEILYKLLTGSAIAPLYYLIVLIQLIILTPLLIHIIKGNNLSLKILCYSITLVHLIILYSVGGNWVNHYVLCSAWFFFYYLGLKVKYSGIEFLKKISVSSLSILIICTLFISVWEGFAVNSLHLLDFELVGGQVKLSSFLYAFLIILLILKVQPFISNKRSWLTEIGDLSFGIYLIHNFFMIFIFKIISYVNFEIVFIPAKSLIITALTLFISYYVLRLTRNIIGDKLSKTIGII